MVKSQVHVLVWVVIWYYIKHMKNPHKGFVVPLLIGIIALLVIGGGIYIYKIKNVEISTDSVQTLPSPSTPISTPDTTTPNTTIIPIESLIRVISPNGGETFNVNISDDNAVIPITFSLKNIQGLSVHLIDSTGNKVASMATDNRDNGTSVKFYVNQQKISSSIKPGQYKIKVCNYTETKCDLSDNYFTIVAY